MGNGYRKVNTNMYFKARKQAAEYDDRLSSREGASELIGVSESTLADYELGGTKVVPVDKVCLMAEYYHSPELKNWYCKNECPIGKDMPIATELKGIEGVVLKMLQEFSSDRMNDMLTRLIDIAQDGEVTEQEIGALKMTMNWASDMEMALSQFRLSAEKIMGERQ
jgi:transcriptional regulator with XRE-family HTH domain